jgi:putative ATPase
VAKIVAHTTKAHFTELSAVTSGVADVRSVAQQAKTRRSLAQQGTVLFIDEIHRFSKSQQDALLPLVEVSHVVWVWRR